MKNTLVTVIRFTKLYQTRFVKEKLESEGIECVLTDENFYSKLQDLPSGWNLQVKACDVEKTVRIIVQIQQDYGLENIDEFSTLKDLKKILVPVDLANYSKETIGYVLELAKKLRAEIKFLYVLEEPHLPGIEKSSASWEEHGRIEKDEMYKKAQNLLLQFSDYMKSHFSADILKGVRFHFAIHTGNLGGIIVGLSQRYNPDFIVLGHKIKDKKETEHLPRVVHYITEHSKSPLIVLPRNHKMKRLDGLNVMFAANFKETEFQVIDRLVALLKPLNAEIHCTHIECNHPNESGTQFSEFHHFLEQEYPEENIHAEVYECSNFSQGIEEFVDKNNIDLISFTSLKHNFLYQLFHPDIIGQMVITSKVPLLLIPIDKS